MSRYLKKLATLVVASLAFDANTDAIENNDAADSNEESVKAAALNEAVSIRLAQHRSHSSHASHSSHRSSASGSRRRPAPPPPSPPPPKREQPPPSQSDPLGQEPRPPGSYPPANNADKLAKTLKDKEARKNIIMRMQLTLQFEGLYDGPIDGLMGSETRKAVLKFKKQKGIPGDKVLDAPTLNAFGILGY